MSMSVLLSKRWIGFLWLALLLASNPAHAAGELPKFMTPVKHADAQGGERLAYSKAALETFAFILYSNGAGNTPDYKRLIDCYKSSFDAINMNAHIPWAFARNLEESMASVIYHSVTALVCDDNSNWEKVTSQSTLKITNFSEWATWSESEKLFYVGGYIDAGVTAALSLGTTESKRNLERYKRTTFNDKVIKQIIEQVDAQGLELDKPLPWSIAAAFGRVLGSQRPPPTSVNKAKEANKTGGISSVVYTTYLDAKIMGEICQPHLVQEFSAQRVSALQSYEDSMACYAEKSLTHLMHPLAVKFGMQLAEAKQMTNQFTSAYPDRLARVKSEFAKFGLAKARLLCKAMVDNHKFSNFVLAEKLDATYYQFGRMDSTRPVFDSYMKSVESCPKIFSLENSVAAPAFLQ